MIWCISKGEKTYTIGFEGKTDMVKLLTWLGRHGVWFNYEPTDNGFHGYVITRNHQNLVELMFEDEDYWQKK